MFDGRVVDELDLLQAWHQGDQVAGAALFEQYYPSVARFFRNKVSDVAQEDLIHETFLGCLNRAAQVREQARFRTFLFSVAHRVLADHWRRTYRRAERLDDAIDVDLVASTSYELAPVANLVQEEEQRLVLEALRRIPVLHQVALELYYWEELTAAEIGEVLGIPLATAKTRLRDGRLYLEDQIRRIGHSLESLQSTLDNLDLWARRVRAQVSPPADVASQAPR